jgi:hypothetical protein
MTDHVNILLALVAPIPGHVTTAPYAQLMMVHAFMWMSVEIVVEQTPLVVPIREHVTMTL